MLVNDNLMINIKNNTNNIKISRFEKMTGFYS